MRKDKLNISYNEIGGYCRENSGLILLFSICILVMILIAGCEKKFDEYYKVPEDLIGTILDVLKEDGNYSYFIEAVEKVEYDDVLGKTGNFTVFAPDDNAFRQYFNEKGISSLDEIPEEELKGIVYYHIVFWAYSKYMLLFGLGIQDADIDYTALNFKQITKFTPPASIETDTIGRTFNVYHESKFIPVYSTELFTELDLDAANNYSFLYPGSHFNGFHADRAEVTEADVPAQNGWIHKINRVLIPPDNHDEILGKHPEFSIFKKLLDKNTFYEYNNNYTTSQDNGGDVNEDGVLDSLFLKMNSLFPPGSSPATENVRYNGKQNVLTLFVPTDDALLNFFNNHTEGYNSLYDIGPYWMNWYLTHYIGLNHWPEEFSNLAENWESDLATNLVDCNIYPEDILYSSMASNGPFCGINKYFLPKLYESIAGPVFGNKDYEWFSEMLIYYMADKMLNEENLDFTLFIPSNDAIYKAGYSFRNGLGGWGLYSKFDPLSPIPREIATDILKTHIVFGEIPVDDFESGTFIETSQHSYIGVEEGGIYSGGDLTLSLLSSPETVEGKGVIYKIDRMMVSPDETIFDIISNTNIYPQYQKFYQLCYMAGLFLLDENQYPLSLNNVSVGTYYTCFIPTNDAIEEAENQGIIPEDQDSLEQFMRYHFVESVIFPDGRRTGTFNTTRVDEESGYLFNTIEIINQKYDLKIKDGKGNIRTVVTANHMAQDGVIHQIDSILQFK